MLRLARMTCAATAIFWVAAGCSWQQAYYGGQGWQRNMCNKLVDQTERERCLSNANMTYEDYRRQTEGSRKD